MFLSGLWPFSNLFSHRRHFLIDDLKQTLPTMTIHNKVLSEILDLNGDDVENREDQNGSISTEDALHGWLCPTVIVRNNFK